jgi:hypothetical protein
MLYVFIIVVLFLILIIVNYDNKPNITMLHQMHILQLKLNNFKTVIINEINNIITKVGLKHEH